MTRSWPRAWMGLALLMLLIPVGAASADPNPSARIFVLMVWDGLRPDSVNPADTPMLSALAAKGTRFVRHHSLFPTATMVNGAALATGAPPGINGILGNSMFFGRPGPSTDVSAPDINREPTNLEHTKVLAALNAPNELNGDLLEAGSVAQEALRAHAYVAIIGKPGPTFLFDDLALAEQSKRDPANFMFMPGDNEKAPPLKPGDPNSVVSHDAWYTRIAIDQALPAARAMVRAGHSALVVLWQQNPDATQHMAGLGTRPALDALHYCDANLGRLQEAITQLGVGNRTDLMVISDHGFATIRMEVAVGDLLVSAGLKKSRSSDDVLIARNGGNDLVYLSRNKFSKEEARRAILARIVDFVAAQDWSGPLFSHPGPPAGTSGGDRNLGWIPGTFSQDLIGIQNPRRSPDLVISFRELTDADNRDLTGDANRAFVLGIHGQRAVPNHSDGLVHPVAGVVYADNPGDFFTTGMGMHGAAGEREIHNFCAVSGPDFKHDFADASPSGNLDIAPTIRQVLGLPASPQSTGRVLAESMVALQPAAEAPRDFVATTYLVLQGAQIITELKFTRFGDRDYLEGSSVSHNPIGPPQ